MTAEIIKDMARRWVLRAWRYWPAVAAAAAAATLATAHAFEAAGYEPCLLCYRQREVYWGALAIAALSSPVWALRPGSRITRSIEALLGVTFLTGALVAGYHAGVEWGFWPGPERCAIGSLGAIGGDDLAAALSRGGPAVSCDVAAWRDPVLRLSMAGWNVLISLALGTASFFAATRGTVDFVEPARA